MDDKFRYRAVTVLFASILLVLVGRSFYLQVWRGAALRTTAEGNRVAARLLTAPRGIIYDAYGRQLVENVASTDVVLNPVYLPSEENESILVEKLPELLAEVSGSDVQEALRRCRTTQRPVRLATALDHDAVLAIEQIQGQLPGVELASSLVRRYDDGRATAPLLGYTSYVSNDDLREHAYVVSTDIIGKTGLEYTYDAGLHGRHGVSYEEIDAAGVTQKQVRQEEAVAGNDLHLNVDFELQKFITDLLTRLDEEKRAADQPNVAGAVVALDPRTGGVRALVSYPIYDANIFSQPRLADQTRAIIDDPRQVLFNRAVSGMYPPGSTIKPYLAAAALEEEIITSHTTIMSTGGIQVGPWSFPDWKSGGHGLTDVRKAVAESVNTFFYAAVGGEGERRGLGLARARQYLEHFGWGKLTGADLPNEAAGFLPTEEWKMSIKNEPWYIGDTYHLAIGQGDVLVTPLQVAMSTAAIANGGYVYAPSVAHVQQRRARHIPVRTETIQIVKEGMRQAVTEGSGRALAGLPVALAGKTGTAQAADDELTHAWFTSFGPWEAPELVVTVLLEGGGAGDIDAVPVAREIWEWWAKERRV